MNTGIALSDTDVYDDHGIEDGLDTAEYSSAVDEISAYIQEVQVATVANIARKFPQHQRVVFSILHQLKQAGKVHWDEWRPLPTTIYAGDRRIPEMAVDWNAARERSWALKEGV